MNTKGASALTNSELADRMEALATSGVLSLTPAERAWLSIAAERLRYDHSAAHRDSQRVPEKFREG